MGKLDVQLLALLDRRARAARRLGELRRDQPAALPLTDHAAIRALVERSSGDMPRGAMHEIFRGIFAACLSLELPVPVAFVGPPGGPGDAAARGRFGAAAALTPVETTPQALDEVARRRAEFAVVPFETSTEGPVGSTLFALMAGDLRIAEMLDAGFELHLMNRTGQVADVERVAA